MNNPYRFFLQRDEDVSGISGTGRVCDGILWVDRTVSMRWRGEDASFINWDQLAKCVKIHGHGGKTRLVWIDDPDAETYAFIASVIDQQADAA